MRSRWQPFAAELRADSVGWGRSGAAASRRASRSRAAGFGRHVVASTLFLIVTLVVVAAYSAGQQLPALWTVVDAGWSACVDAAVDLGR